MARMEINPERYQAFLDAFLHLGPHYHAVARRVGCSLGTAKKAWETGWPRQPYGAPISRVYAESLRRLEANRTALVGPPGASQVVLTQKPRESDPLTQPDRAYDAPQQAQNASQQSPTQILQESALSAMQGEIDLLTCFRGNLIGAITVSNKVLRGLEALAESVAENTIVMAQNVAQATPERLLKPLERFARIMGLLSTSTEQVMKMQRLLVGAPQQITENRGNDPELSDRVQRAAKLFEVMARNGLIPAQAVEPEPPYQGEESDAKHHDDAA